jgi:FKBP-type peptidyl-prolyl cis-trans isomerase
VLTCVLQDITKFKDGGVKKKILRAGKGPKPTEFAECEIQYIGYFTNGKGRAEFRAQRVF